MNSVESGAGAFPMRGRDVAMMMITFISTGRVPHFIGLSRGCLALISGIIPRMAS